VGGVPDLNAIGIVASDPARSIAFYRLLGVDFPQDGEDHIEAILPSGVRLMLDAEHVVESFRPDWTRATGNQLALAFECASPAEVDATYARIAEAGFQADKEPWDASWGQRYAQARDPDGVPIDLFAAL
jgi:uncharacterized glyoxalase superfamily protein PhnB